MAYNKYNVAPKEQRMSGGRSFSSKGERDCFEMLKLLERAGEIDTIECQVKTHLTAGITHNTDFKYWDLKTGENVWAEYKGLVDQRWRDIQKLWGLYGPGKLKVFTGYGTRVYCMKEITPESIRGGYPEK